MLLAWCFAQPTAVERATKSLPQRIDLFVEEILITAAHVTLYKFNVDLSHWSRKDVEGSLFVVKRNTQPRFQFIVMNCRNTGTLTLSGLMLGGTGVGTMRRGNVISRIVTQRD